MAGMPSLVKQSLGVAEDLGKSFYNYMAKGALHNIGAEPVRQAGAGITDMKVFGRRVTFRRNHMLPEIGGMTESMGFGSRAWAGTQVLGAVASAGFGFMEGGPLGALKNVITDIGVDAAMVKHGYRMGPRQAGVSAFHHKGIAQTIGRYGVGSLTAYGVSGALGGGIIGTAGALVGGSLGVRHAGKIALAAGGYYGAKTVARGTYQLVKAGHSHFQAQKQIQTDGEMAAFQTSSAFTMRGRAVQAIQRSHSNSRTALGKEAQYMSNPSRSYFSPYRQF